MCEEIERLEIPSLLSATPASQYGTPRVTINREATIDLDSTNSFEGPEKLLEVWFSPSVEDLPESCYPNGLKVVEPDTWKDMLDLVNCKILSIIKSEHMDAYLLSESSMFVFPHKLILKTCGTTTLLAGVPLLLEIAALSAGFSHPAVDPNSAVAIAATPYRIFYSRKNFQFPMRQRGPHRNWSDEVRFLDSIFLGGSAYLIGKMNGEHWHLWLTGPNTKLRTNAEEVVAPTIRRAFHPKMPDEEGDETLEILMTNLDVENARQFFLKDASGIAEGRHLQRIKEARKDAISSLGTLKEAGQIDEEDEIDVFGQNVAMAASDDSERSATASATDDELTLPEELTTEGHALGTVVANSCGLADVYPVAKYPNTRIDAYLFNPCGFSANGVVPGPMDLSPTSSRSSSHYFTVHVTPEPHCSFASFETNVPAHQSGRETADIVEQVVKIFKPGRFSVTLFEETSEDDDEEEMERKRTERRPSGSTGSKGMNRGMDSITGYARTDRILHTFNGYSLVFRHYERVGWTPDGEARG